MERLTKRATDGQAIMDCEKCKADWTGKHGKSMVDCTPLYCRNRLKNRLAAYEETGLTPEQCESAKNIIDYAFSADTSKAERILELLKADKDGRLVVLPCKVGDTVWMWNADFGTALPYVVDLISVINEGCGYSANCNHNGELLDSIDFEDGDIGKTIFLTRDEAEKALEAMQNE